MKTYPIPLPLMQEIINILQELPWNKVNLVMVKISPIIAQVDNSASLPAESNGKDATEHKDV